MKTASRADLLAVASVDVQNVQYDLGIVKDFHNHELLDEFVPEPARLSLSWVHPDPRAGTSASYTSNKSMIIVAEDAGRVKGEVIDGIQASDIVVIPPGARHGFAGDPPQGFWPCPCSSRARRCMRILPRVAFDDSSSVALLVVEETSALWRLSNAARSLKWRAYVLGQAMPS